jgi:hypothetical protein
MTSLQEIANELKSILGKNFSVPDNCSFQELKLAYMNSELLLTDEQSEYFDSLIDPHASTESGNEVDEDFSDDYEYDYACDGPGLCKECGPVDDEWSNN